MTLVLILYSILLLLPCLGYWLYRKWRLAQLEACFRTWNPPLVKPSLTKLDLYANEFIPYDRQLIDSITSAKLTMQEASDNLIAALIFIPEVKDEFECTPCEMLIEI